MKPVTIDFDRLSDYLKFVSPMGYSFVDVQNTNQDTLFVVATNTSYPLVLQHRCSPGSWKSMIGDLPTFEAAIESESR